MAMSDVEVLRAACCIAGLDKQITPGERKLIDELAYTAGVGQASLAAMLARAERDQDFYREQFRYISADPEYVMKTLFRVAVVDHDLHMNERVILQHFAERLKMTPERFDQLLSEAEQHLDQASETPASPDAKPSQET